MSEERGARRQGSVAGRLLLRWLFFFARGGSPVSFLRFGVEETVAASLLSLRCISRAPVAVSGGLCSPAGRLGVLEGEVFFFSLGMGTFFGGC